jgi:hypothetical protein
MILRIETELVDPVMMSSLISNKQEKAHRGGAAA